MGAAEKATTWKRQKTELNQTGANADTYRAPGRCAEAAPWRAAAAFAAAASQAATSSRRGPRRLAAGMELHRCRSQRSPALLSKREGARSGRGADAARTRGESRSGPADEPAAQLAWGGWTGTPGWPGPTRAVAQPLWARPITERSDRWNAVGEEPPQQGGAEREGSRERQRGLAAAEAMCGPLPRRVAGPGGSPPASSRGQRRGGWSTGFVRAQGRVGAGAVLGHREVHGHQPGARPGRREIART